MLRFLHHVTVSGQYGGAEEVIGGSRSSPNEKCGR